MKVLTSVVAVFVSLLLMTGDSCAQNSTFDMADEVDQCAKAFREKYKIPVLSLAIGHAGKIVYARAYGLSDLENAVNVTEETVFRTASIAKSITAVAVLQLVDQGKISLDDPIQKHCPEFPETDDELTVRHLLCHQGGVRHYKHPGESSGTRHHPTIEGSLALFKDEPLLFKPGTKFSYTTYGYSLLGRAVETASGKSFREYVYQYIFDPTGMEDAGLDDTFRIVPNRTRGYNRITASSFFGWSPAARKTLKVGQIVNCDLHDTSMKVPGGGLICSTTDLVKFGQAMLTDQLIDAETTNIAWQGQQTAAGQPTDYGLGWVVWNADGSKVVAHSGGQAGTSTMLIILPDHDVVVAVMCNLQGAPSSRLASELSKKFVVNLQPE